MTADVIFHRTANGEVLVHDKQQVARFASAGEPLIDDDVFHGT